MTDLSARLQLRMRPDELDAWKAAADKRGVNVSDLVRGAVARDIGRPVTKRISDELLRVLDRLVGVP